MEYKRFGLIALMALAFTVILAGVAFADAGETITWINPLASGVLSGGTNVNITLNVTQAGLNTTNMTFLVKCSDTNATTYFAIGTNSTTNNLTAFTLKFNASVIEDSSKCTLNASGVSYNKTPFSQEVANIVIDDSVPTAATAVTPADKEVTAPKLSRTISFSGTNTAADSTTCRIDFSGRNPGLVSYLGSDMGATATNCTITISNVPEGTYTYSYYSSDGRNNTVAGAPKIFTVDYPSGAGKAVYYQQVQEQQAVAAKGQQDQKKLFAIIVAIVVITMIMKKGQRKR